MKIFPLTLIPHDTKIDFMRMRWVTLTLGALVFALAMGAIATKGFNFALDFTGGTAVTLRFEQPPNVDEVRGRLAGAGYGNAQVQTFGSGSDLLVRLRAEQEQLTTDQGAQLYCRRSTAPATACRCWTASRSARRFRRNSPRRRRWRRCSC
jgi:preprotein translocase subunit SecF